MNWIIKDYAAVHVICQLYVRFMPTRSTHTKSTPTKSTPARSTPHEVNFRQTNFPWSKLASLPYHVFFNINSVFWYICILKDYTELISWEVALMGGHPMYPRHIFRILSSFFGFCHLYLRIKLTFGTHVIVTWPAPTSLPPTQPTAPLYDDTFEKLELDSEGWRQMVYEEIKLFVADPSLYTQSLWPPSYLRTRTHSREWFS